MNAYEVPLIELLKRVPKNARFLEVGEFSHAYHPVGRLCHEAADRIAELEKQSEPVGRYYWESVADGIEMAIPSATTPHYMKDDFPLYLAPQTKPLSDEEIQEIYWKLYEDEDIDTLEFARAILRKAQEK